MVDRVSVRNIDQTVEIGISFTVMGVYRNAPLKWEWVSNTTGEWDGVPLRTKGRGVTDRFP